MTYELYYYRLSTGRDLKGTHELDISMRDNDEAVLEPHRRIDPRALTNKILALNLGFKPREDHDVFSGGYDSTERRHDSIQLVIDEGLAAEIAATVWECHLHLALPTGEPHPERDEAYEKVIRDLTFLCHDENLYGYDPKHERPVSPSTLHEIAVDAAEGEKIAAHKPWWHVWG